MLQLEKYEWYKNAVDFIFPPLCLGCGEYTEEDFDICLKCRSKIEPVESYFCLNCLTMIPFEQSCPTCERWIPLFALSGYQPPLNEIIKQFKFKGITKAATFLIELIWEKYKDHLSGINADAVIPIPLYSGRANIRGYNQAEILARGLADKLNLSLDTELLYRIKKRHPQARIQNKDRHKNIKGVFETDENINDIKNIIIVDDVVTSGSTMREAVRMLEKAGINVKAAVTAAHSE